MVRFSRKFIFLTTFGILILPFLFGSSVFADAEFSTITMTTTDANFSVSPTETGNFVESMTPAIINVTTNNYTGYKLTLESTSSTAPALTNLADNSKTIPSITSTISENDFLTSSSYNNMWGISPSKLNSAANSNYIPAPTATAITLEQTNAANPTTSNSYSIFAGTRINYAVEAGYYSATLIAKTVINPATYTITYNNSLGEVADLPLDQSGSTSESSVFLSEERPYYSWLTFDPVIDTYIFMGWCSGTISNQFSVEPVCLGATYQPNTELSVSQIANNEITLDAIWAKMYYMQGVSVWGDIVLPNIGDSIQAIDSRDGKFYWVTRLADGNIWMTQNLDLDLSTTGLSSVDSDIGYSNGVYPSTTVYWDSDSTYAPQTTETTTSSSSAYTGALSWDLGDYVYDGTTNSSCGTSATSYADCTSYGFSSASGLAANSTARHYHVGNLYQWNAATAGSGGTIISGEAQDSICPKGWRLPTGASSGEFQALVTAYSANSSVQTLLDSPLYFVRGGHVYSGTLRNAGGGGNYWSSTPDSDSSSAYDLYFGGTSSVYPSLGDRYYGFRVRCVAREKTMQNVAEWKESLEIGDTVQVEDGRDGEMYLVGKLADGKIWMLDNLRLGGDSAIMLTSADTNISSSYTLPAAGSWTDLYTTAHIDSGSKNTTITSYGSGSGKIGVYYNYCAASAGTICSSFNSSNASYDICPKGWRLPTGGDSGEFQALYIAYSSNASSFRFALSTPLSGYIYHDSWWYYRGEYGLFWSSTCYNNTIMYRLFVSSPYVYPVSIGERSDGYPVRCISQ